MGRRSGSRIPLRVRRRRGPLTQELLAELERVTRCTEQALYYAHSEHAYSIQKSKPLF